MQVKNLSGFISSIEDKINKLEQKAVLEVTKIATELTIDMMSNTPVWSGETVRNYAWGTSMPSGGPEKEIGSQDPGATNSMSLGSEPRRPANEAAALSEIKSIKLTTLQPLYGTNKVSGDKWDLVDNGAAPTRSTSRSPGGVSRRAVQKIRQGNENIK